MKHLDKDIAQLTALGDNERINRIVSYKWDWLYKC